MKARPPSPYLDVRNVMWLLAAMVFVMAPHIPRLPTWVGIFIGVVIAWRAWISWAAWHFPNRWLVAAITVAATIGTFLTYGRIFGREAGTTLLLVMAALKLLEMRSQREVVLAIYLGFFLVITNFLFSQSIPLGLYMLVCVWVFVAVMVGFNRIGKSPSMRERLAPAGALMVQALPLMVAFFILFPRAQGPIWALPQDARAGQTGLSDTMSPGNISNLIKSDDVAFRVVFEGEPPPMRLLYWRGPVLVDFDGAAWRMRPASSGRLDYARRERVSRYAVTLEPHQKNWLIALDVPGSVPERSMLLADMQLRALRPVEQRLRYEMASHLDYRFGTDANTAQLQQALRLEGGRNPRAIALGRRWASEDPNPRVIFQKAANLFNTQFTYTLEPPLLDREHPYDDFLFRSKAGFCEHYAGSFALLMRAAGVPARIVTGYQGGGINPINNEMIVRQSDAHAWTEIWLKDEGWLRVDPTGAVSPLRVEEGVNAALGPIGLMPSIIAADPFGLLAGMRNAWQAMNSQWESWVVGYTMDRQRQFFGNLGFEVDWRTLGFYLLIATALVAAAVTLGLLVRDRPPRREASLVAWDRFCAKLAAAGLERAPHEGPLDYTRRIATERPALREAAGEIGRRYISARYGEGATREELRELARKVRDFKAA